MLILIRVGKYFKLEVEFLWFGDTLTNMSNAVTVIQLGLWIAALITQIYLML